MSCSYAQKSLIHSILAHQAFGGMDQWFVIKHRVWDRPLEPRAWSPLSEKNRPDPKSLRASLRTLKPKPLNPQNQRANTMVFGGRTLCELAASALGTFAHTSLWALRALAPRRRARPSVPQEGEKWDRCLGEHISTQSS